MFQWVRNELFLQPLPSNLFLAHHNQFILKKSLDLHHFIFFYRIIDFKMKNAKQLAAEKAIEFIKEGMTVGLGTGTTVYFGIIKLSELIKSGLNVKLVSTSKATTKIAEGLGMPLSSVDEVDKIDITIDGADEVDPEFRGIKGGGGALLAEKIIAGISKCNIWVVDSTKRVDRLGAFPLPVEVVQFGFRHTMNQLNDLGFEVKQRLYNEQPFVTDSGHYITDIYFQQIDDPLKLEQEINNITGVVENGLFNDVLDVLIESDGKKTNVLYKEKHFY